MDVNERVTLLTNPDTQMYSNIKTMTNGAIKVNNFGMNFNFAFRPLNFICAGGGNSGKQLLLFDSITAISIFRMVLLIIFVWGERNRIQNAAAWITGTISMKRSVSWGETPSAIRPAQLTEPIIPADPVPDAHAVITFLKRESMESIKFFQTNRIKSCRFSWMQENYLLRNWAE